MYARGGSPVDPCQPGASGRDAGSGSGVDPGTEPKSVRFFLGTSMAAGTHAAHVVLRGTYLPGTVRCEPAWDFRGQFYGGGVPPPGSDSAYAGALYAMNCYIDVRVNAYALGSGPPTLTVLVGEALYNASASPDRVEELRTSLEQLLIEGGRDVVAEVPPGGLPGREEILFLAPAINVATEVWQVIYKWDVQRQDGGAAMAIHPDRDYWKRVDYQTHQSAVEMTLPAFTQAVTAAHQARVTEYGGRVSSDTESPMVTTDADQLRQFYTSVSAYRYPGGPPTQPPPPCGLSVTGQLDNPRLMDDCAALLAAKDPLRGAGALNWDTGVAITAWDGVTVAGTPQRVTKLKLANKGLTGTIPASLADLTGLNELKLAGNTLTGCIPVALRDVASHDLDDLGLLYCPPPPAGLTAGTPTEFAVPLTWTPVANAARYRVEHRSSGSDSWTVADDDVTTASYVASGLACGTAHGFRVSSYGGGTVYSAEWSEPSATPAVSTAACVTPEFGQDAYTFEVAEDAAVDDPVGTVSATDPDAEDTLTYSITAGNTGDAFAIGGGTGAITVAAALDHETTPSYTLTVWASDGQGGEGTATVTVTVTDVAEDAPPAPTGLTVSLADGTFSLSWTALDGAAKYEAQHKTGAAGSQWAALPETTGLSAAYAPEGGPACSAEYQFRVRAYGDGDTYTEMWGPESGVEPVETATCDPEFDQDPYAFKVAEDAAVADPVGTVSATDPDAEDTVTYSITAGNTGDAFAIGGGTGAITVAAALDHETTPSYTLTVKASDGKGGTATATVTVTVTDVAEDAPPAPTGLSVSLADGTFSVSWDAVTGAAKYEGQWRTGAAGSQWAALPETTGLSAAYASEGGPDCGAEYRFRVRAYGDGGTYTEMWGAESGVEPVETATCNPEFGQDSYDFFVLETAATGSAVGTVSATDPDATDTVSYTVRAGNDEGKLALDRTTGRLTVAGDLDLATTPAYSLTVEASDGQGGTATARVRVALTIADCANGTVVPQPAQNQHLVRDCSVLLTAKDTLRGAATLNWSADTPISGWDGVRRRGANPQYVGTLYLPGLGLDGSIPAVLAGLADLRRLDLDDNALTGSIPAALGSLEDLEQLYLFNNQLTGAIPAEFGKLRSMRILSLYDNDLTGAIPPELGNLKRLRELLLDRNDMTGELPTELGNLTRLKNLYVRDNRLAGAIPTELGSLANLTYLYLEGNGFTGCVPSGLRDVANHDLDRLGLTDCTP